MAETQPLDYESNTLTTVPQVPQLTWGIAQLLKRCRYSHVVSLVLPHPHSLGRADVKLGQGKGKIAKNAHGLWKFDVIQQLVLKVHVQIFSCLVFYFIF